MVGGAVSIAARSVYPGKQAPIPVSEALKETKRTTGKVVRRAPSFVGHECGILRLSSEVEPCPK
jgi:hypothetical protein